MYTLKIDQIYQHPIQARAGQSAIIGDEWASANPVIAGDIFDEKYFGTNLRYKRYDGIVDSLPLKVKVTGRVVHCEGNSRKVRVLITTWDQDENPVSFPGWLLLWSNYEDRPGQ